MHFLLKNPLFHKLKDPGALEADRRLLEKRNPKAKCLSEKYFSREKNANEILYELLDHATEDEIVSNRKGTLKDSGTAPTGKQNAAQGSQKKKSGSGSGKHSGKKGKKRR